MPVTKYQYDEITHVITTCEFERETKTRLVTADGKQLRKDGGYKHDFYDSYAECRKATESILGTAVRAAKELAAAKRADLKVFRFNNPKQGR